MNELRPLTNSDLSALKNNVAWQHFVIEMQAQRLMANGTRDKEEVTRDSERLHLGIVKACESAISFIPRQEKALEDQRKKDENNAR